MYKEILGKLTSNKELNESEIFEFIDLVSKDEINDVQIAGFQVALLMKGVTLNELSAIAKAMMKNCISIKPSISENMMDTCGTGGGLSTFNISTATAILSAAAGIPIAKHGSRSIASLSGSADVLEALDVEINLSTASVEKMIEEIGIAFIYAPLFHPVMCKVLPPEQDLGIKTVFYTIIGPLINPANSKEHPIRHLLGVYKPEILDTVSHVAKELGYTNAMFVHGLDGLDEISLLGKTRINELKNGEITTYEIAPEDLGLTRCTLEEIKTGSPKENADTIKNVFSGKILGAKRDAILLNAAGALMVGGKVDNFKQGISLANDLIDSGAATKKLASLSEMSKTLGEK